MGEFPSKANQFKPGQSGNPRGRPPGFRSVLDEIKKLLVAEDDASADQNRAAQIALAWLTKCMEGDIRAIKELLDRTEGPVEQKVSAAISKVEVEYVDPPKKGPDD